MTLILSIFPGVDLLGRAFEEEWPEACIVRGPDLLWGGDIRRFSPPAGKFDGVIGGPPCKGESDLAHLNGKPGVSLASEFHRVVRQANPAWWVMEAVKRHEAPCVLPLSPRWLSEPQSRLRFFHSNLPLHRYVQTHPLEPMDFKRAVLAGHGCAVGRTTRGMTKYSWPEHCRLQGLPEGFDLPGFTRNAKYEAVGNGVPIVLGRAVAKAVKRALAPVEAEAVA